MKELSIEQKAKRYDDAIKKAESLYKAAEPMSGCNVIIETLFPELKESEDEKIRKEILNYLYCFHDDYEKRSRLIDWLEKQGEHANFLKDRVQPKQDWSKEDEKKVERLINLYKINLKVNHYPDLEVNRQVNELKMFFKSLRTQSTWKPSKEQINALAKNVEYVNVGCTQPILKGLLEDLKKLKGE